MSINCNFCGQSQFRPSRFRFSSSDLSHVLVLRFPVRCMRCSQRTYASLMELRKIRKARDDRRKEREGTN